MTVTEPKLKLVVLGSKLAIRDGTNVKERLATYLS